MESIGTYVFYVKNGKKNKYRSTKDDHKYLATILPEIFLKNDGRLFFLDKFK